MRLEITRRADLAVRAVEALAATPARLKSGELAEKLGTTTGFVAQVVGPLVKAGWIGSEPGPTGGYSLKPGGESLSVLDVIEAIDGPLDNGRCVAYDRPCRSASPCILHAPWQAARRELSNHLAAVPAASPLAFQGDPS